jgi:uncharacterized protein (UPF0333 family)
MAESAFQTQYRDELIAGFERNKAQLRDTCTTEGVIKGNSIVFDVVDSGSATAVTRGLNGLIPGRPDNNTQYTCSLTEWHDIPKKTNYNIFASQGDQRGVMQRTSMAVMNRKIDDQIIVELATGTQYAGLTATTLTMQLAMRALAILGNANVPIDGNLSGLLSPAAWGYLMQVKEVTSKDYVNDEKLKDAPVRFRWAGITWMVHSGLPGNATSSEKLFVYHKAAIGHGMDVKGLQTAVDYNSEQDYSFCRMTGYMGAKLLQNSGVVVIRHDGSSMAATA